MAEQRGRGLSLRRKVTGWLGAILAVTLAPADAFELWQIPLFILLGVCCG